MKSKKGFTLAEMLIVVAIIAVIIAIALPSFVNLLEKSREATDLANLRSAVSVVQDAYIANEIPHKINKGLLVNQVYYDKWTSNQTEYYYTYVIATQKKWGWSTYKNEAKTNIAGTLTSASIYGWNVRISLNGDNAGEVIITGLDETGGKKVRAANGVE